MKKSIIFFAFLVLCTMGASVNAQTLTSSTVTFEPCFDETINESVTSDCSYTWSVNKVTYKTSGNYTCDVQTSKGCTETHKLALTITKNNCAPDGAINGLFSVASGKQVYFSCGNLQFKGCTATAGDLMHQVNEKDGSGNYIEKKGQWRFAEHQYDYIGAVPANANYSMSNTEWRDLLVFGASGYDRYHPASAYNEYTYSPEGSLVGNYINCDWGVYNAIVGGGNTPGLWRVLTKDEWQYLLGSTSERAGKCNEIYIYVDNNNYGGLAILPDVWSQPGDCPTFERYATYNKTQWDAMEAAGAVFLPSAGSHNNNGGFYGVNYGGDYWSSTTTVREYYYYDAYFLNFWNYKTPYTSISTVQNREGHRSVRLVCDKK